MFHFTSDERYLELAKRTASHFLNAALAGINGSLCCGRSGECYALLSVYNATKDDFYLTEAKRMANQMLPLFRANEKP
ncbi:lanthionine synthetase LanC family protein [Dyadobacter sp. MSC1_007]|uniref:lanthionine synthetase LanC family protein n=1 Tax=Dyadobacter sp. MSC1_007 TaxID=2909264 RepID=UPI0038D3D957